MHNLSWWSDLISFCSLAITVGLIVRWQKVHMKNHKLEREKQRKVNNALADLIRVYMRAKKNDNWHEQEKALSLMEALLKLK